MGFASVAFSFSSLRAVPYNRFSLKTPNRTLLKTLSPIVLQGLSPIFYCNQFGEFPPGLWAATAAGYCPSRPGELPKLIASEYTGLCKKRTVLLSSSLAWPAVAGCSRAETYSQLSSIYFAQPCTSFVGSRI